MSSRFLVVLLIVLCLSALIAGSFMPHSLKTAIGTAAKGARSRTLTPHLLYHVVAFALTTLLILSLLRRRKSQLAAVVAMIALGVLVELGQLAVHHDGLNIADMYDDTFGVLLAFLLRNCREPGS